VLQLPLWQLLHAAPCPDTSIFPPLLIPPGSDTSCCSSPDPHAGHLSPADFQLNEVNLSNWSPHVRQMNSYIGMVELLAF
jgi:hypothetical protein